MLFEDSVTLNDISTIVHINDLAGQFGGTEEYISSLSKLLYPYGIESYLIHDKLYGDYSPYISKHIKITGLSNNKADNYITNTLFKTIQQIDPQVVIVHSVRDARILQTLNAKNRGYSIFWFMHDLYPTCLSELRLVQREQLKVCSDELSRQCLHRIAHDVCIRRNGRNVFTADDLQDRLDLLNAIECVDAVIVTGGYLKNLLLKNVPQFESKINIIPRQTRISKLKQFSKQKNEKTLLYTGRIAFEKGLHVAIEALWQLRVNKPIIFKIAGPVEDESYWMHCKQMGNEVTLKHKNIKIEYLGHLNYDVMDSVFAEADIVVIPTLWGEPLSTVASEALINSTAVVASDVGGIRTFITHRQTGLLTPPNDPAALAEALQTIILDKSLQVTLSYKGHEYISNHYTAQTHLSALTQLIRRIHALRKVQDRYVLV